MPLVPYLDYRQRSDIELPTAIGQTLDDLISLAREEGCSEQELRERFEEALERAEEER